MKPKFVTIQTANIIRPDSVGHAHITTLATIETNGPLVGTDLNEMHVLEARRVQHRGDIATLTHGVGSAIEL